MTGTTLEELVAALGTEFEFIRTLGRGSMGTVHLAREVELRRLVAIKVPHEELAREPEVRARFEREARAAARIGHPGAASVFRVGTLPDATPYIVMEYVEGRTMDDVLAATGPLDVDTALSVLEQVASALAAAHATGVVHRDLRPGNVIWNADTERAVLTDFGIAGILETGNETVTRITKVGQTLGRVDFSSPEQLSGEPVTGATDVYSLGVLAYHLVSGRGPYAADSGAAGIMAHIQGKPEPLRERASDLPQDLAALFEHCLDKTPTRRPDARRIAKALTAWRTGTGEVRSSAAGTSASGHHDSPLPLALQEFLREVRRRRVGGVALAYLFLAFGSLQVLDGVSDAFDDPGRVTSVVVALLVVGFPVSLWVSWLYDFTRMGIERTDRDGADRATGVQLALQVGALALSLALSIVLAYLILR